MATLREAVQRQARAQRGWFDTALLHRQRRDVMASLGEVIYELAVSGELGDLEEFPEVARLIHDLEEIDGQIEDGDRSVRSAAGSGRADWGRSRRTSERDQPERERERERDPSPRVWRPVVPPDDDAEVTAREPEPAPEPARAADPERARPARGGRGTSEASRRRPVRKRGGIAFVEDGAPSEDGDLRDYMNEDDVPDPGSESGSKD
jgi:hypothetical protein